MKKAALFLLSTLFACATTASHAATASGDDADSVKSAAKDAYFFTYPLVMNYRTMYKQAIEGDGEMGKWLNLGLSSPADTDIVTPNNDTPYSYAWVDLRAEPWVLTMPKIEKDRFYTSQWDDLWGYVLDNAGSVFDGNDGISILLASPDWKGELPKGVDRVVHGESEFLGTLTRTQVIGGEKDMKRVKEIQASYKLQPLSAFIGASAPKAAPAIDWPEWKEGDEKTEKYWDYVAFLLPFITPNPDDKAMYATMESFGMERGQPWDLQKLDPTVRKALQAGLNEARAEMKTKSEGGVDAAKFFGSRKTIGTDYVNRAMGVYMGIFGNVPQVSVYLSMPTDANGKGLDGSKTSYTLHFEKNQLPPVKYFWSITMYRLPQRLLVENSIDRYSIGSSTPGLQKNEDGSLTLYVSAESPGKDKESNWLPAPKGPFWTVMRCYGPSKALIDGSYKQPEYISQSQD